MQTWTSLGMLIISRVFISPFLVEFDQNYSLFHTPCYKVGPVRPLTHVKLLSQTLKDTQTNVDNVHMLTLFTVWPKPSELCSRWAFRVINVFIELGKLLTFSGLMNGLTCLKTNLSFSISDWIQSRLFNVWFSVCLFSRWQYLMYLSDFWLLSFSFFFSSTSWLRCPVGSDVEF